jgi:nicotinic acid mononucleotide adenylyltransferase
MKIAVLFGSFNPFTNAHLAAMKTAVDALQADKGLFVATNGQYLRKKTVKRNDPFYLTVLAPGGNSHFAPSENRQF